MTIEEKAAQMIIADFRTWTEDPEDEDAKPVNITSLPEAVRNSIELDRFGGIILFAENCMENAQTLKLVNDMQLANQKGAAGTYVPLFIAIDQEGGSVARLGQGTRWPGNMAIAATGDPENASAVASHIGQELSSLGINVDFAPVLDVNNNPSNPVIGGAVLL